MKVADDVTIESAEQKLYRILQLFINVASHPVVFLIFFGDDFLQQVPTCRLLQLVKKDALSEEGSIIGSNNYATDGRTI